MYDEAIQDADEVLSMDRNNVKALYRRALASQSLADSKYTNSDDKWISHLLSAKKDLEYLIGAFLFFYSRLSRNYRYLCQKITSA